MSTPSIFFQPPARSLARSFRQRGKTTPARIDVNIGWRIEAPSFLLYNTSAIKGKILNLLNVLVGQEHFEAEWGSNLPLRIFDPINSRTAHLIEMDTIMALTRFMRDQIFLYHGECVAVPVPEEECYAVIIAYEEVAVPGVPQAVAFILNRSNR